MLFLYVEFSHVYSKRSQDDSHLTLPFAKAVGVEHLFPYLSLGSWLFIVRVSFEGTALKPKIMRDFKLGWEQGASFRLWECLMRLCEYSVTQEFQVYFYNYVCEMYICYVCLFLRK
jgi:hypothetical protein